MRFDHATTRFRLLGQHRSVPCTGCHDLRDFRGAATSCGSCHTDPHRGDAGPICEQCHAETGWHEVGAQNAHARTRLPELGVHAALRCDDCHRQTAVQPFSGRVTPCVACHQATYDATTDPPHRTMSFATTCETCHQFTTWRFALFAQHGAVFPIYSGAHAGNWSNCAACHSSPLDFRIFVCTTCHGQARTDPRHQGVPGYLWASTACLACHPQARAGDVQFHEAIFPINSGTHAGKWTACTDCHADPANPSVFSCMSGACHPQATTTPGHAGITGYQYVASQCLSCHPDGRAGTFAQHDAVFPINTGTHAGKWTACSDCHTDPASAQTFSCMTGTCHPAAATNGNHLGIPNYQYVAAQCLACHPTGAAGTFAQHDALFFPIYGGSHAGRWSTCSDCHNVPNDRSAFTCMGGTCHPAAQTNGNHQGISNYSYLAARCYSCHPQGRSGGAAPFRAPRTRTPGALEPPRAGRAPSGAGAAIRRYVREWIERPTAGGR